MIERHEVEGRIEAAHARISALRREVSRVVIGQRPLVDRLIVAMLVRGHLLLEGVPGLAKTLVVKTLASAIEGSFRRIQFTPDLLPADITGTLIFDPAGGTFNARLGPVFANLVLADEINRAPAKVQSALLEAMQERQVTIGETTYPLPEPFVVVATQNPIDQEGTYVLPEAQIDRFVMKVVVPYPSRDDEHTMLMAQLDPSAGQPSINKVLSLRDIADLGKLVGAIHVDERVTRYIVEIVNATREPLQYGLSGFEHQIAYGASPRATLALAHVAKAWAFLSGRPFVTPQDVKQLAPDVLRHRLILTYEAAAEQVTPDDVVARILGTVAIP